MGRLTLTIALMTWAVAAQAQEDTQERRIDVELNTAATLESGCQLSFLISTTYPEQVDSLIVETVIFDASGGVNRLTLFDFGQIPSGRPRVRQFVIPETSCDQLSRLLINGVNTCSVANTPDADCQNDLTTRSRTDLELIG